MKKNRNFIFRTHFSIQFSQNTRFVYQVSMKTDSTAAPKIENAYLDISTEKSIFLRRKKNEKRFYHSSNDGNQKFQF